ncbi:hypothetical protein PR048_031723 [Dryococelus australis]|uniref:Uncharacterized protein n=1 Tax=Dryococelus australis TaxID=614101 RepID=A0ABQ9GA27_9NEOP|nr:hypothetical protein PR048_031723 [Dryococelus australis]
MIVVLTCGHRNSAGWSFVLKEKDDLLLKTIRHPSMALHFAYVLLTLRQTKTTMLSFHVSLDNGQGKRLLEWNMSSFPIAIENMSATYRQPLMSTATNTLWLKRRSVWNFFHLAFCSSFIRASKLRQLFVWLCRTSFRHDYSQFVVTDKFSASNIKRANYHAARERRPGACVWAADFPPPPLDKSRRGKLRGFSGKETYPTSTWESDLEALAPAQGIVFIWCAEGTSNSTIPYNIITSKEHDLKYLACVKLFSTFEGAKCGSNKADTAAHIKCAIAVKREALNRRVLFFSHCVYLRDFQRCTGVQRNWVSKVTDFWKSLDSSGLKCVFFRRAENWKIGRMFKIQRYDGNTARFAHRSDEALGACVSVARIFLTLDAQFVAAGLVGRVVSIINVYDLEIISKTDALTEAEGASTKQQKTVFIEREWLRSVHSRKPLVTCCNVRSGEILFLSEISKPDIRINYRRCYSCSRSVLTKNNEATVIVKKKKKKFTSEAETKLKRKRAENNVVFVKWYLKSYTSLNYVTNYGARTYADKWPLGAKAVRFITDKVSPMARALASHLGDPGPIPSGFTPGLSHVGIVLNDAACRWVFSDMTCHFESHTGNYWNTRPSFLNVLDRVQHLRAFSSVCGEIRNMGGIRLDFEGNMGNLEGKRKHKRKFQDDGGRRMATIADPAVPDSSFLY